jgi:hypothetical protein
MPEVEKKDAIMEMVRQELSDDPDAENKDLYAKAKKIDPSVDDLSLRQFHARYPLQVKRKMAQSRRDRKKSRGTKKPTGGGGSGGPDGADAAVRETIRSTLLRFARDVSAADGKAEMIDILSSVDDYVDDVVDAVDAG